MDKSKKGFAGKWIDIISTGTHTDDKGNKRVIDASFLEQVVGNLQLDLHEPPAVIGHPKTDAPAYAWVCGLRVEGDLLQGQFCDSDPNFEEMVRNGRFKKRSASFYLHAPDVPGGRVPALRHVGFLGAQPPAVKGLRNVEFNEGEAVTFADINFSEGEGMDEEKVKSTVREQLVEFLKNWNLFGSKDETEKGSFSEADVKRIAEEAVTRATASFTEENKKLATALEEIKGQVSHQSGVTTRADIISFCEGLGKAKFPPAFKELGVIEFMEKLATVPDDVKVTVINFEEKDGTRKEIKTERTLLAHFKDFLTGIGPVVQFGEHFGNLQGTGDVPTDPEDLEKLRKGVGTTEGGAK